MNDNEKIDVILETVGEKELLKFKFTEEISIDLTLNDKEQLRQFFSKLLKEIESKNIVFEYKNNDRKDLISEVAEKYVANLNNELSSLIDDMPTEIVNE